MRKLLTVGILSAAILLPNSATAEETVCTATSPGNYTCTGGEPVENYTQSQADAAWEGLDSTQQAEIKATGLQGIELDKLVIRVRDGKIEEDEPGWDCATMGNKICGSPTPAITVMTELPKTS